MRRLETGGLICGLFRRRRYEEETVQLEPGDLLVIFSDGISEALNAAGEEFGDDRILDCVNAGAGGQRPGGARRPGRDGHGSSRRAPSRATT